MRSKSVTSPGTLRRQRDTVEHDRDTGGTAARQHAARVAHVRDTTETNPVRDEMPPAQIPAPVRLIPGQPPGRSTRKALPYAHEIRRLHALGYTLEAIRLALSEAGVLVSRSTVHRETSRRTAAASLPPGIQTDDKVAAMPVPSPSEASPDPAFPESSRLTNTANQSGKDSAESFFAAHPSNPLFPTQETS